MFNVYDIPHTCSMCMIFHTHVQCVWYSTHMFNVYDIPHTCSMCMMGRFKSNSFKNLWSPSMWQLKLVLISSLIIFQCTFFHFAFCSWLHLFLVSDYIYLDTSYCIPTIVGQQIKGADTNFVVTVKQSWFINIIITCRSTIITCMNGVVA